MAIVICGGGIMGSSIAYHLAQHGVASTVVERCHVACAASGKAGGFLAREWCNQYVTGPLAQKGFDMHTELATALPGCDFRRMHACAVTVKEGYKSSRTFKDAPDWLDGNVKSFSSIGTPEDVAQVHPEKLTKALIENAEKKAGTKVLIGTVKGIDLSDDKKQVKGVIVDDKVIAAETVVIAMGPWSYKAADWLPVPKVTGHKAHSILIRPTKDVSAHALFTDYISQGMSSEPEFYPRPDGDVYVCGSGDRMPLPDDPAQIKPNSDSCEKLKNAVKHTSSVLAEGEVTRTQACYLPMSPDGWPVIGKVPGVSGAYIAAGHHCWGILTAPATGAAMAELILKGKSTVVDLSPFDPARFE